MNEKPKWMTWGVVHCVHHFPNPRSTSTFLKLSIVRCCRPSRYKKYTHARLHGKYLSWGCENKDKTTSPGSQSHKFHQHPSASQIPSQSTSIENMSTTGSKSIICANSSNVPDTTMTVDFIDGHLLFDDDFDQSSQCSAGSERSEEVISIIDELLDMLAEDGISTEILQ